MNILSRKKIWLLCFVWIAWLVAFPSIQALAMGGGILSEGTQGAPLIGGNDGNQSDDINTAGQIIGAVQCFDGSIPTRAIVYVPGDSLMVKTNDLGEFRLRMVPGGTYELRVEALGEEMLPITPLSNVKVDKKSITDVGTVLLACSEICDGEDNNGDGNVDEGLECGESGVLDCGSLTECSGICVDTSIDVNNCGGCGVVCAAGEVCFSGMCEDPIVR